MVKYSAFLRAAILIACLAALACSGSEDGAVETPDPAQTATDDEGGASHEESPTATPQDESPTDTPEPTSTPPPTATPAPPTTTPTPVDTPTPTATPTPAAPSFGDGTWIVGADIPAGTYRTWGGSGCYWARLSGFGGSLDETLANDFVGERLPLVVTILASDVGFESDDCGTWSQHLAPVTAGLDQPFGGGTYIVGVDIGSGTWRASGGDDGCYWERVSGFTGDLGTIIANDFGSVGPIVTIAAGDAGFSSSDCGTWEKIG